MHSEYRKTQSVSNSELIVCPLLMSSSVKKFLHVKKCISSTALRLHLTRLQAETGAIGNYLRSMAVISKPLKLFLRSNL